MLLVGLLFSLSSEQSKAGGADGGGGNAGLTEPVSEKEIAKLILSLPFYLPPILYTLENYNHGKSELIQPYFKSHQYPDPKKATFLLISVLKKIFEADAIYVELKKITFKPNLEDACKDLQNEDKDGSAFNEEKNEICLSVPRLQKRVNNLSLLVETLALAIHELSHRLGATEPEAQIIQYVVNSSFQLISPNSYDFISDQLDPLKEINFAYQYESVFKAQQQQDMIKICTQFGKYSESLRLLVLQKSIYAKSLGFQTYRPAALKALKGAQLQLRFLLGFCEEIDRYSDVDFVLEQAGYPPGMKFPLVALKSYESFWDGIIPGENDGFAILGKVNDWDAALFNYQEFLKNIKRIEKLQRESFLLNSGKKN